MILYTPEGHGCAYSIDTEGTLFYIPIHTDGTINLNEIDEVDTYDLIDSGYEDEVKEVHEKLISMIKSIGEYYQTVS
jgi:hypothetical protein